MSNRISATQRRLARSSDRVANRTLSTSLRCIVTLVAVASLAACSKKDPCEPDYTVPEQVSVKAHSSELLARDTERQAAAVSQSIRTSFLES
jgi:predicted component of type VI protein secretion system